MNSGWTVGEYGYALTPTRTGAGGARPHGIDCGAGRPALLREYGSGGDWRRVLVHLARSTSHLLIYDAGGVTIECRGSLSVLFIGAASRPTRRGASYAPHRPVRAWRADGFVCVMAAPVESNDRVALVPARRARGRDDVHAAGGHCDVDWRVVLFQFLLPGTGRDPANRRSTEPCGVVHPAHRQLAGQPSVFPGPRSPGPAASRGIEIRAPRVSRALVENATHCRDGRRQQPELGIPDDSGATGTGRHRPLRAGPVESAVPGHRRYGANRDARRRGRARMGPAR